MLLGDVSVVGIPLEVITGAAGLLFGAVAVRASAATAREWRQPIVITHEDRPRTLSKGTGFWFAHRGRAYALARFARARVEPLAA
jgi:hypothetical protein